MAKKKKPAPDADGYLRTGIYQRFVGQKKYLSGDESREQAEDRATNPAPRQSVNEWLGGVLDWATSIIESSDADEETHRDSQALAVQVRLAMHHNSPEGDPVFYAGALVKIGELHERIGVRDAEPLALSERGRRRGASEAAKQLNECFTALHPGYQPAIDELQDNGAGMSYEKATAEVATEFRVDQSTVKRNTVNRWPRHGSRHKKRE